MALPIQGNGGVIAEVNGSVWRALHMTDRPPEFGAGGYYRTILTALTAAAPAAGANLASFRWTSSTLLALIRRIELKLIVTTAFTGAVNPELAAYVARTFSASDSAGTAVVTTTNNMKKRTAHATSALATGDLRFATAGVLTAGTRTLDPQPISEVYASIALGSVDSAIFGTEGPGDHPIVLAQNEGLVFQNVGTTTAGIFKYIIGISWAEIPLANY